MTNGYQGVGYALLGMFVLLWGCGSEGNGGDMEMGGDQPQSVGQPASGGAAMPTSSQQSQIPTPAGSHMNGMASADEPKTPPPKAPPPKQKPDETDDGTIEVAGEWIVEDDVPSGANDSIIGDTKTVSNVKWDRIAIVAFDNEANFAVLQSGENDPLNPGLFNRVEWTQPDGELVDICHVAQGLMTLEEARQWSVNADSNDLNTGCNGFPWTRWIKVD